MKCFLLIVFLTSCGGADEGWNWDETCANNGHIMFDKSLLPIKIVVFPTYFENIQIIEEAKNEWNKQSQIEIFSGPFLPEKEIFSKEYHLKIIPDRKLEVGFAEAQYFFNFETCYITGGNIKILRNVKNFKNTLKHEMGHMIGLAHDTLPYSIMSQEKNRNCADDCTITSYDLSLIYEEYKN